MSALVRRVSEEEEEVVNAGLVSLSRSGKSLITRVLNQRFFVPPRDLQKILDKERGRANVKQWIGMRRPCEQSSG